MSTHCDLAGRCMAVILAQLRQLPAFWACQERAVWNNATRELVTTGQASVGALDDLEVGARPFLLPEPLNPKPRDPLQRRSLWTIWR